MIGSMFAGVTGLQAHQTKMDVIGNNIANVNTVGFKKSTVNFSESLARTMEGAAPPQDNIGGQNPIQVGLGVQVASISTIFSEGTNQTTGRQTDMRIDGDGFFMVSDGNADYYTRAGNFELDGDGYLVTADGLKVQGWQATKNADGTTEIEPGAPISDVNIKLGEILPAKATSLVSYSGNLAQSGGLENLRIEIDADGNGTGTAMIDVDITFTYDTVNERWNWDASSTENSNISGSGYFTLDKGQIINSNTVQQITNGSTVLIDPPITGDITFRESKEASNTVTASYVDNIIVTSNEIVDTLGKQHAVSMEYSKIDENIWEWQAEEGDGLAVTNGRGFMTFDAYGQIAGNYVFATDNPADSTLLGTISDGDGNTISTFPSAADLGVAFDTSVKANYLQDGDDPAVNQSPYYLDSRGIIKFRGVDPDGDGVYDQDADGNTITPVTLSGSIEEGKIMNVAYSGTFSFDPAKSGGAIPPDEGAEKVKIYPDFTGITQFASDYTVSFDEQNGYTMGELETFRISDNGDIVGYYSNNYKQVVGRISVTQFFNPGGLEKVGSSLYTKTPNSGEAIIMEPGTGGAGSIVSESLEMSNVDLAQEFTDMIIAQRGFQANSKTITTSDQMLQDLINLKR